MIYVFLLTEEILVSTQQQRQKRDVSHKPSDDNILLVQSIQITDKFGFQQQQDNDALNVDTSNKIYAGIADESLNCLNGYGE